MRRILPSLLAATLSLTIAPAAKAEDTSNLPLTYIGFSTISVPIVDDYRALGLLQTRLVLRVEDRDVRAKLSSAKPRMVDDYVRILSEFARLRIDPSRPVDVRRLQAALQTETDRLVPEKKAQVLILETIVRRS